MEEGVRIPRGLDSPPQLLLWQVDELSPVIAGMIIGIAIEQLIICVFVGFLMVKVYKKLRDGRPDGYPIHFLYWFGVIPGAEDKIFTIKDAFHRNWVS